MKLDKRRENLQAILLEIPPRGTKIVLSTMVTRSTDGSKYTLIGAYGGSVEIEEAIDYLLERRKT